MRAPLVLLGVALSCAGRRLPEVRLEPVPLTEPAQVKAELAQTLLSRGQADAALSLVAQLRAAGHRGPELDVLHGRALHAAGLFDDAETMLLSVGRRNAPALSALGVLYLEQERLDEAVAVLQRAHRINRALAANNLGFALLSAGRSDEAVEVLRGALMIDSANSRVRGNLGFALVACGRTDEALRVFGADGSRGAAHFNVGVGQELMGQIDDARASYQAALTFEPEFARAAEALARLEE